MTSKVAVETQQHEATLNLIWSDIDPFFALDSAVKDAGGSRSSTLQFDGEEWRCTLYYQDSGIAHPGKSLPDGTPFRLDTLREYRIDCKAVDGIEEKKVNYHIAPRWDGMKSENGKEIPVPPQIESGINVRASGANYPADMYVHLLRNAAAVLDVNGLYFAEDTLHPYSNVQDLARYVRLDKDQSGPIHARSGPIAQMGHLLESDRSGYRSLEQVDTDKRGRDLPGWRHKTILGSDRIQEMTDEYRAPKEIKHYYAEEAAGMDAENPLAHPKLEVSYQTARWDETIRYTDLDDLNDELETTLYAVLKSAGLSLYDYDTGENPENDALYVSDKYFDADSYQEAERVPTLGLDAIQQEQEHIVVNALKDGLSPVQWESIETLIADGGQVSPQDIAEEHDRHPGSVRRALNDLDDLIKHEYDSVSLRSKHVAEMAHEAVKDAEEAVRRAVETGGKALAKDQIERLEEAESALQAYAASRGMDVTRDDDGIRVRFRQMPETATFDDVKTRIRDLIKHWRNAGRDMEALRQAKAVYSLNGYQIHQLAIGDYVRT